MEDRVANLEIKLGDCEDSIAELNKAVFRQQQQIDLLQGQLREVYRLLQAHDGPDSASAREEPPPHF